MTVKVVLEIVHGWAIELTKQDVAPLKEESASRSLLV